MEIRTVTRDFLPAVASLFSSLGTVSVFSESDQVKKTELDLVVFTGGEDINPAQYGRASSCESYNDKRDKLELDLLYRIKGEKLRVKKVLGICRGMQLLNVGFGGTLHLDLEDSFGKSHHVVHTLAHATKNPLDFLHAVNSMHHQGISRVGQNCRSVAILAKNPADNLPEIVCWDNKFLGVQFHPEFFSDEVPEKQKFAQTIEAWINGEVSFDTDSPLEEKKKKPRVVFETSFPDLQNRAFSAFTASVDTTTANARTLWQDSTTNNTEGENQNGF